LEITTDADPEKVQVTANTVAFLSGGFDRAIIRIGTNTDTVYNLDDSPAVSATTTAQGSVADYAAHVKTQVEAQGYDTGLRAPGDRVGHALFNTGEHTLRDSDRVSLSNSLMNMAQAMRRMRFRVTIEGFTDRQQYANRARSDELNRQLGDNRARELQNILLANGAPPELITMIPSRGEAAAEAAGDSVGQDNQDWRMAEIKTPDRTHYWLFVHARSGGPNLNAVAPNKIDDTSSDNGFIYLYKPTALSLSGKKVTIDGTDFPIRGAAAGGHAIGSPEAYAKNMADDINANANATANLKGSNSANVVTVTRDGDPFRLTLVTAEQREISLSGTSGVTVTTQFSRSRTSSLTRQNTGNRTVAVGASLDVRYSRQFEMNVTGNSSISARLVSIPAPPQFLETIREFLTDNG
jgi:outer membrane protein OmpA-like peptidoglycan-associated protein